MNKGIILTWKCFSPLELEKFGEIKQCSAFNRWCPSSISTPSSVTNLELSPSLICETALISINNKRNSILGIVYYKGNRIITFKGTHPSQQSQIQTTFLTWPCLYNSGRMMPFLTLLAFFRRLILAFSFTLSFSGGRHVILSILSLNYCVSSAASNTNFVWEWEWCVIVIADCHCDRAHPSFLLNIQHSKWTIGQN